MGDDFGLPNQPYSHGAHHDEANSDDKSFLCFGGRNTKAASDPSHGKRSPSTLPLRCGPLSESCRQTRRRVAVVAWATEGPVQGEYFTSIALENQQLASVSSKCAIVFTTRRVQNQRHAGTFLPVKLTICRSMPRQPAPMRLPS
jgi:hypothetical protein